MIATHSRHDHGRLRRRSSATGSQPRGIRASTGPTPISSTSRWSSCWPICGPTGSRPSSSPAAASNSCGRGREKAYGIPPEQVVGSSGKTSTFERRRRRCIDKLPEVEFVDDGPGKPVGIDRFIGAGRSSRSATRTATCRCSQWTTLTPARASASSSITPMRSASTPTTAQSHVGKLDKALDEAPKRGWLVVDMKNDWKTIYKP